MKEFKSERKEKLIRPKNSNNQKGIQYVILIIMIGGMIYLKKRKQES
jgi:hypothetical protein